MSWRPGSGAPSENLEQDLTAPGSSAMTCALSSRGGRDVLGKVGLAVGQAQVAVLALSLVSCAISDLRGWSWAPGLSVDLLRRLGDLTGSLDGTFAHAPIK